jgi:hypothetical protein
VFRKQALACAAGSGELSPDGFSYLTRLGYESASQQAVATDGG